MQDTLTASTGAVRLIPGSHRTDDAYAKQLQEELSKAQSLRGAYQDEEMPGLGVDGKDVPAFVFESVAGDIVIFDHNTKARALPCPALLLPCPPSPADPPPSPAGCGGASRGLAALPAARILRRLRHPPHVHRAAPSRSHPIPVSTPQLLRVSR